MSGFSFADLQEVAKEAGFDLVPDGEYEAVIDAGVKTKKTGNGKDMITVKFKLLPGQPAKGAVFNNFVISPESPNALAFFFRHMKALGLGDEFFAGNPTIEQVAKALEGRTCRIKVGHREYNGTDRNEVTQVSPSKNGNGSGPVPMAKPAGVPSISTPTPAPVPAAAAPVTVPPTATEAAGEPDDPF